MTKSTKNYKNSYLESAFIFVSSCAISLNLIISSPNLWIGGYHRCPDPEVVSWEGFEPGIFHQGPRVPPVLMFSLEIADINAGISPEVFKTCKAFEYPRFLHVFKCGVLSWHVLERSQPDAENFFNISFKIIIILIFDNKFVIKVTCKELELHISLWWTIISFIIIISI